MNTAIRILQNTNNIITISSIKYSNNDSNLILKANPVTNPFREIVKKD